MRPAAAQRRAHAAALDHGQQARQALHQRGGQLQRLRRRLPRGGHVPVRVRQPAVLAGVRPDLARQVRLRRRPRRHREGAARLDRRAATRRRSWRRSSACRPTSSTSTIERWNANAPTSTIPTSGAARARTTAGGATRRCARARARRHARAARDAARTTRSRSTAARSAPRAGRRSTRNARVLDVDGDVIPGLYAAGNVMGSPFGMTYGGAGRHARPGDGLRLPRRPRHRASASRHDPVGAGRRHGGA